MDMLACLGPRLRTLTIPLVISIALVYSGVEAMQCEPIDIPLCSNMLWNVTRMPNLVGQSSQLNARLRFEEYSPLVFDRCSDQLQFFLCALFVPVCTTNIEEPIKPCRDVCEKAKTDCLPTIQAKYNQTWPVDCSTFPEYDTDVCISPRAFLQTTGSDNSQDKGESNRSRCNCRKKTKMHVGKYVKSDLDYVIRAKSLGSRQINDDLILSFTIKTILKNKSNLRLRPNATLMLFSEDNQCRKACPKTRKNKDYIIACNKNINLAGRMVFDKEKCMMARWNDSWATLIPIWDRIAALPDDSKRLAIKDAKLEQRRLRQARKTRRGSDNNDGVTGSSGG